jgi:16S rRNA (cytosine967-C5)-methyltransferase
LKLHQNIITNIEQTLHKIFVEHRLSDKEVPKVLKNKIFGSRDRSLIASCIYDIVRWKRKYYNIAEIIKGEKFDYKILIAISLINRNVDVNNFDILSLNDDEVNEIKYLLSIKDNNLSIENSYDEIFYTYCLQTIGNNWHELAASLNEKASVYITINTAKISLEKFAKELEKLNIDYQISKSPDFIDNEDFNCIEILSKQNLKISYFFQQKYFYFQDIGSQIVGNFVYKFIKYKSNISVLDYCAGHGGKSFQLSILAKEKATIFATDFDEKRLESLKENRTHKNIKVIEFRNVSTQRYDVVFIDAPCSGTGTFRRQPDLKYNVRIKEVDEKMEIQKDLLEKSIKLLKENGIIIYATCSILPQENSQQIASFMQKNPSFHILEDLFLLPSSYNSDGFYMCALQKI